MKTRTLRNISTSVLAMYFQVLLTCFITIKWQEKKLSMIKIFKLFVSDDLNGGYSCLSILFPRVIIPLVPRASQHGPLGSPALNNFFESNLNFKGFRKVNRITVRAGTERGTSGVITFVEKDPEAILT